MLIRCFFLLFTWFCFAQQPSHYIIGDDELAGVNIYSALQGKDNTVWLSTNTGLFAYDGTVFTLLPMQEIKDQSLFGLTQDRTGKIYCHNLSGQVLTVENNTLKVFCQIPERLISGSMFVAFDNQNQLVVSCKDLIRFNRKKTKFEVIFDFKEDIAEKLTQDEKASIFFWNEGFQFQWHDGRIKKGTVAIPKLSLIQNHAYYKKGKGFLYFANLSNKAILQTERQLKTIAFAMPENQSVTYRPLIGEHKDLVWLAGSKNGVYCFQSNGTPLFNNSKLFSDFFISSYLEDREGNVWLCTFGKGIVLIPNMEVTDYSNASILEHDDLSQITKKGNLVFFGGTSGRVFQLKKGAISLLRCDFNKVEFLEYAPKSEKMFVNDRVFDAELKKEVLKNDFHKYGVFENQKNDSVFYVTRSGLFLLNPKNKNHTLGYSTRTYGLYNDEPNGVLWLSSSTGLEKRYKGKFSKVEYNGQPIFSNGIVGFNNQVWVASNTGIYVFRDQKLLRHLTTKQKLVSDRVTKIHYNAPYVYVASNEGLQRFTADFKNGVNFTKAEGLLSNTILDFEVMENLVYVVSSKGLQCFNFNTIENHKALPDIFINQLLVNGSQWEMGTTQLSSDENTLEFNFHTITFLDKRNLNYRYRLEGYDEEWRKVGFQDNKAIYAKLPAGKYTFIVQLTDGINFSKEQRFGFEIEPVFWKKWQFLLPAMCLVVLGLFLLYRLRVNYLLQKSQIQIDREKYSKEINKSKLAALNAQMNPHFMFNALNSIQEFILQNKKEQASNYLGDFADLMRSYLQHSQEDKIVLHEELETLKLYLKLEKLRFDDDFEYEIKIDPKLEVHQIEIPSFLIQPFVENAIKHGLLHKKGEKQLVVSFEKLGEDEVVCRISDNGVGREKSLEITKNKKHKSFATQASVDRFQLINQNEAKKMALEIIDVKDAEGAPSGTTIVVRIPINK
ncbi:sensor histidine kinase [Flavobacterium sp. GCM10023249]|uniref:sensor histidine kinase n=1 Tax=unclassified Flavobacterium TaxID=196869 RepID=UPI003617BBCD